MIQNDTLGCWARPKLNYLAESATGYQAYKSLYQNAREVVNICGSELETCEIQNEELRTERDLVNSQVVIERDRGDYYKSNNTELLNEIDVLTKYKKAAPWIGGGALILGLIVGSL